MAGMIDWDWHADEEDEGSRSRRSKTIPLECQVFRAMLLNLPQLA
jgi:hypothetical protein